MSLKIEDINLYRPITSKRPQAVTIQATFGNQIIAKDLFRYWIPDREKEGYSGLDGYDYFITRYELEGVVTKNQLEQIATDRKFSLGKNLAGLLSIILPPEMGDWRKIKYLYEQGGAKKIDITKEQVNSYIYKLANKFDLKIPDLLRLHRIARLYTDAELGSEIGSSDGRISNYESGDKIPIVKLRKTLDELEVASETRDHMLRLAGYKKLSEIDKFGDLVNQLRTDKPMTLEDLSKETGISVPVLSEYESHKYIPEPAKIHRLCDALKADAYERLHMLDLAGNRAIQKLEDSSFTRTKEWRKAFKSLAGGGNIFGAAIYNLREKKKLSREELANASGVSLRLIEDYESGNYKFLPRASTIEKLCTGFGFKDDNDEDKKDREIFMQINKFEVEQHPARRYS